MQLFLLLFLVHKSDKWTPIGAEFQIGKCHIRLRPLGTARVHVSVSETSRMLRLESKESNSLVGAPESTSAWQSTVLLLLLLSSLTEAKQQVLFVYFYYLILFF